MTAGLPVGITVGIAVKNRKHCCGMGFAIRRGVLRVTIALCRRACHGKRPVVCHDKFLGLATACRGMPWVAAAGRGGTLPWGAGACHGHCIPPIAAARVPALSPPVKTKAQTRTAALESGHRTMETKGNSLRGPPHGVSPPQPTTAWGHQRYHSRVK